MSMLSRRPESYRVVTMRTRVEFGNRSLSRLHCAYDHRIVRLIPSKTTAGKATATVPGCHGVRAPVTDARARDSTGFDLRRESATQAA
jgi:hypothetical protein